MAAPQLLWIAARLISHASEALARDADVSVTAPALGKWIPITSIDFAGDERAILELRLKSSSRAVVYIEANSISGVQVAEAPHGP